MKGETQVKFTLGIGFQAEQEDVFDLEKLVENWADLTKQELDDALFEGWKRWIWEYIDGGPKILDGDSEDEE